MSLSHLGRRAYTSFSQLSRPQIRSGLRTTLKQSVFFYVCYSGAVFLAEERKKRQAAQMTQWSKDAKDGTVDSNSRGVATLHGSTRAAKRAAIDDKTMEMIALMEERARYHRTMAEEIRQD